MVPSERWGCWCCEHYVPGSNSMVCRFQQPAYPYGPERGCVEFQPRIPSYASPARLREKEDSGSTDNS